MIKIRRPAVAPEKLEEIFSREGGPIPQERKRAADALWYLDQGIARAWDPAAGRVNAWVKRAILAYFRGARAAPLSAGCFEYLDKLAVKRRSALKGVRVVPGAIARYGSFIEPGAILMPSFVNVGARVGHGTMVDTWATVGSCAQIGAEVHLSGGVGIGGVLEPAQASPVIIEDGAFLGSRAVVVEGVRVGVRAVLGAGVVLTASTKIIDVRGASPAVSTGEVPAHAVVIPGTTPRKFPAGEFGAPCALIVGTRSASTDLKTSLNAALRENDVPV